MGLGKRFTLKGEDNELFKKTETVGENAEGSTKKENLIRKQILLRQGLAEDLREFCYLNHLKESQVIREALERYLKEQKSSKAINK